MKIPPPRTVSDLRNSPSWENNTQTKIWHVLYATLKLSKYFFEKKKKKNTTPWATWSILNEILEKGIRILVGQVVLELLIKTIFCTFWSITHETLGLLKISCRLWVLSDSLLLDIACYFSKNSVYNFGLGCISPLTIKHTITNEIMTH